MDDLVKIWDKPSAARVMIAGWHQWADAGKVSSGLPQYLIEQTQAVRIGEIAPDGFYLFQFPGTHHLLRPVIKLSEGYRESLERKQNEFYYTGDEEEGFVIFLGEEPHQNEERYAEAFFDAVEELGIKRVAALAGVYGSVPYDRDREISCVYSLPGMKEELTRYAVEFSNYEGGVTISMYLADRAEAREIEFFRFCAFVPSYDFSKGTVMVQPVAIGQDFKAWYDIMVRLRHMFRLNLDLGDLERMSEELIAEWDTKIEQLAKAMPHLRVKEYMQEINDEFDERPFIPLSDVWEEGLRSLLDDF